MNTLVASASHYMTNEPLLTRGLELLEMLKATSTTSVPKTCTSYSERGNCSTAFWLLSL